MDPTRGEPKTKAGSEDDAVSVSFFGMFYPEHDLLGSVSTSLVHFLAQTRGIDRVRVFAQEGASLPRGTGFPTERVQLKPSWQRDSPLSLVRALASLVRSGTLSDIYVFNMHMTYCGRSRIANGIGLLLPVLVRFLARRPVITYMHNLLETQDVISLGYRPTLWTKLIVRFLEFDLIRNTRLVVPLASQAEAIAKTFKRRAEVLALPNIESAWSAATFDPEDVSRDPGITRVLLFGNWGPQKDLPGALACLDALRSAGYPISVTVAGSYGSHHPDWKQRLAELADVYGKRGVAFLSTVPEDKVFNLFMSNDVLLLPYNSTGGYSGAMNLGSLSGASIIAYDCPQLREYEGVLRSGTKFISPRSAVGLASALDSLPKPLPGTRERLLTVETRLQACRTSVERFAGMIIESARDFRRSRSLRSAMTSLTSKLAHE